MKLLPEKVGGENISIFSDSTPADIPIRHWIFDTQPSEWAEFLLIQLYRKSPYYQFCSALSWRRILKKLGYLSSGTSSGYVIRNVPPAR